MRRLITLSLLCYGLLLNIVIIGQVCLNPPVNYIRAATGGGVCNADFNGDGKIDIAISEYSTNSLSIFLGSGLGTFTFYGNYSVGLSPVEIISADFNNDGKLDLAIAGGTNNAWVLLGDGLGGFGASLSLGVVMYPTSLCAADFNNDGKLDLMVGNGNVANTVSLLLGNGLGGFGASTQFNVGVCPCGLSSLKSADFNLDGNADLAVANQNSNDVTILLGTGAGSFAAPSSFPTDAGSFALMLADFNGDSILDIATSNRFANTVSVLIGSGAGVFAPPVNHSVGAMPVLLITTDINNDGNLDIISADRDANFITILKGDGLGGFITETTYSLSGGPIGLSSGDFNHDGKKDLAVVYEYSSNLSILLNCGCASTITTQPTNSTTTISNTAQFTIASSDSSSTYQWQSDLGIGFQNINSVGQYSGTTNDTLSISSVTMSNNNQPFRCIIRSGSCYDTSAIAMLSVCGAVTTPPANQNVVINNTAQFTTASSDLLATYQWQSDLGIGFRNLNSVGQYSGTSKDTLRVANVTMGNNNQPFRCIVSSGACSDTSSAAVLTVINVNGINETATNNLFTVYPNPAKSQINVKVDATLIGASYAIYDNIGKVTLSGKINAENTVLDLGHLSGGVYLFSIGDHMKQMFTVVKE
jgi:hypothetical protein